MGWQGFDQYICKKKTAIAVWNYGFISVEGESVISIWL
jgi:hypothetical protein